MIEVEFTGEGRILDNGSSYKFECQRCGECCKKPGYFTPDSLLETSMQLGMKSEEFYRRYCSAVPEDMVIRPRLSESGYCIFIEKDSGKTSCRINCVKPSHCRYSPLAPQKFRAEEGFFRVYLNDALFVLGECPGAGKGRMLKVADIVKETRMEEDLESFHRMMLSIASEIGQDGLEMIARARESGRAVMPEHAKRLRKVIEKAYVLSMD